MKDKTDAQFCSFRIKMLWRTALLAAAAAAIVYILNSLLRGQVANGTVWLLQNGFGMGYAEALDFYDRTFRRHMDTILLLSMLSVFFVLLYVYLRFFTRYFKEIDQGMDTLLADKPGEISLPAELLVLERKMNQAKHTMDRQKSEMEIEKQRKNDLIMYLAHDLKTPLASSISYLTLLRDEKQISEELREKYLSISLAKAERLEELINEFLEIAKYNLSNVTLSCREINMTRLLEQLVYEFRPILDQKGLTCRLEAEDNLMLTCDADKLQRVFDNLLRNAVLYSYDKTQITITAAGNKETVTLQFANQGDPIPGEKLDRLFEQFYRLDAGRDTAGTGLGLAIAKQIVALHDGTVSAQSEEGRTVFTVTLPIRQKKAL